MSDELPLERLEVEVRINGHDWQPAVFQGGQFVDVYGLPLDRETISGWRPLDKGLPAPAPRHKGWTLP